MDSIDKIISRFEDVSPQSFGFLIIVLSLLLTRFILQKIEDKYPKQYNKEWKFYLPLVGLGMTFIPSELLFGIPTYFGFMIILLSLIKIYRHFVS
jgi:hypothetical protein